MGQGNVIQATLRVKTEIENASGAINNLKKQFEGLKLNKGLASTLDKNIAAYEKAAQEYLGLLNNTSNGKANLKQMNELSNASIKYEAALQRILQCYQRIGAEDLTGALDSSKIQRFNTDIKRTTAEIEEKAKQLKNDFSTLTEPFSQNKASLNLLNKEYKTKSFQTYKNDINDINKLLASGNFKQAQSQFNDLKNSIQSDLDAIIEKAKGLPAEIEKTQSIINKPNELTAQQDQLKDYNQGYYKIAHSLSQVTANTTKWAEANKGLQTQAKGLTEQYSKLSATSSRRAGIEQLTNSMKVSIGDVKLTKSADDFASQYKAQLESYRSEVLNAKGTTEAFKKTFSERVSDSFINTAVEQAKEAYSAMQQVRIAGKDLKTLVEGSGKNKKGALSGSFWEKHDDLQDSARTLYGQLDAGDTSGVEAFLNQVNTKIEETKAKIATLGEGIDQASSEAIGAQDTLKDLEKLQAAVQAVAGDSENSESLLRNFLNTANTKVSFSSVTNLQKSLKELQGNLNEEQNKLLEDFLKKLGELNTQAEGAGNGVRAAGGDIRQTTSEMTQAAKEADQLLSQFTRFTTLAGIFDILKRSITSAYESVKELDAAMNSIAVVTDMTTSDLWGQIDSYTEMANATGSTIQGAYEVAQLYYQQGLSTNDVLTATTETLKLARVAGIEYADATDYMTAAVKGFGLSYQDLSHIMDVYSNLAAKTAADTEEISIAMSKVASIANSTGMSLENTAGFLTQIIATTRL